MSVSSVIMFIWVVEITRSPRAAAVVAVIVATIAVAVVVEQEGCHEDGVISDEID